MRIWNYKKCRHHSATENARIYRRIWPKNQRNHATGTSLCIYAWQHLRRTRGVPTHECSPTKSGMVAVLVGVPCRWSTSPRQVEIASKWHMTRLIVLMARFVRDTAMFTMISLTQQCLAHHGPNFAILPSLYCRIPLICERNQSSHPGYCES